MSRRAAVTEAPADRGLDLAGLGAAGRPQVNLLPPEVTTRRALGRTKVRLGLGLALFVLVLGAGWALSAYMTAAAAANLAVEQAEVQRLVEAQAQYAEVPMVKGEIERARSARELGTSTEVLYREYLAAIQAVTPDGWTIRNLTTTMPTPIAAAAAPANVLLDPGVGTITVVGRAKTLPDTSEWLDALATIPGFVDPFVSTEKITDEEGVVFYEVTSTVQVQQSAFAARFTESAETDVSGDTSEEGQ